MTAPLRNTHNGEQQFPEPGKIHSDRSDTGTSRHSNDEHLSELESRFDDDTPNEVRFVRRMGLNSTANIPMNHHRTETIATPQRHFIEQALILILRHLFPKNNIGTHTSTDPSLHFSSDLNNFLGATIPVYEHALPRSLSHISGERYSRLGGRYNAGVRAPRDQGRFF